MATGTVEQGQCKIGDEVTLVGIKRKPTGSQILSIEAFKKTLESAIPGDSVGLLLKGVLKDQVSRGMCITAPGKFICNRTFKAQIYVLKTDEGGRHKPFFTGYRPQCFIRTAD